MLQVQTEFDNLLNPKAIQLISKAKYFRIFLGFEFVCLLFLSYVTLAIL